MNKFKKGLFSLVVCCIYASNASAMLLEIDFSGQVLSSFGINGVLDSGTSNGSIMIDTDTPMHEGYMADFGEAYFLGAIQSFTIDDIDIMSLVPSNDPAIDFVGAPQVSSNFVTYQRSSENDGWRMSVEVFNDRGVDYEGNYNRFSLDFGYTLPANFWEGDPFSLSQFESADEHFLSSGKLLTESSLFGHMGELEIDSLAISRSVIPEPSSAMLMLVALLGVVFGGLKKMRFSKRKL